MRSQYEVVDPLTVPFSAFLEEGGGQEVRLEGGDEPVRGPSRVGWGEGSEVLSVTTAA